MRWFQGTADAVRKFLWVFEVGMKVCIHQAFLADPDYCRMDLALEIFFSHSSDLEWSLIYCYTDYCRMPRTETLRIY